MAVADIALGAIQRIALAIAFRFSRDVERRVVGALINRQSDRNFAARNLRQPF